MPVQLIVDCFGIDTEDAIVVGKTEDDINALRRVIREHLAAQNPALLRLRLTHLALLKHFRFDGMTEFLPTKTLLPRALLAERLKIKIPDWLTDEWIVELGLLKNSTLVTENSSSFEAQILMACDVNFLCDDNFYVFIRALNSQPAIFLELLRIDAIKTCLISHLTTNLKIDNENATLFIIELSKSDAIESFLELFAYQQHLALLRQKIRDYALNVALPAQTFSISLLNALPLLPLSEEKARHIPTDLIEIFKIVARKILHKEIDAKVFAEFVMVDWESIWLELNALCNEFPQLMNSDLLKDCQRFESTDAQTFVQKIKNYLAISHYRHLCETASVEETLDWSVGYFDYLRTVLLSKQPLDESINVSFTNWLISQSSRIARSESDWRFCSSQIQRYLDGGYLVIVTVVDALSALNQDILLDELTTLNNLTVVADTLFAPLPTLTDIGKLAVLTGKPTHSLPTNSENALQQTYQTSLKIIKSWEDDNLNTPITEQTNLVVFFENRIDERLHDASSFEKHHADILPIARQLKTSIQNWLKDAAHRDVVFFITADHGMTVTNGRYDGESLGEIKDRIFKLKRRETLPDDFVLINQDSKDDYAVPKTRLGLTNSVLAHGGLTPEEVLIPFIKLIRPTFETNKLPVEAEITSDCLRLGDKFWQLDVRLSASVQVETVRLNLEPPFKLELREPIDIIRAQKSHTVTLKFRADIEQEGLIVLELGLQFERHGARETLKKSLSVNFPASFLARDSGAQSFEDMF